MVPRSPRGNDQLAQIVRRDQDLSAENESLDKSLLEAFSKEPSKRDAAREQQIRDRLQSIVTERAQLTTMLNQRFSDFAALSKPIPISVRDTQALLADDEALVVFDFGHNSYVWVVTRTDADWLGVNTESH